VIVQGLWPATYHVDSIIRHDSPVSLDPHHTHFILVDDGYRNSFRPSVADFRSRLERRIAGFDGLTNKTNVSITHTDDGKQLPFGTPVVVVLVEGGLDAIDFAIESIKCRIPLVVCAGTGRAADIIAYAYSSLVCERTPGKIFRC
jgi:hypothetical protein